MMTSARLSIGIPVYNGARFLPGLLANLARQTFRDYEVVICDNASTDATAEICRAWALKDERIRYFRNATNVGASANFNRVFELATAPLFKWAACDDTYAPDYLETCVRILDENPQVILAQTDVVCVDSHGAPFARDAITGQFIIPGTHLRYSTDPIDIGESASASRRFYDALFRCRSNAQIFGVIRRDALAKTSLLAKFMGAEKVTVLELALLGRFQQSREAKFHRCYHPDITEAKSDADGKAYIGNTGHRYSRATRFLKALLRTPIGKPVGPATVLACYGLLALRGGYFIVRPLFQSQEVAWPFRAAWGNIKGAPRAL